MEVIANTEAAGAKYLLFRLGHEEYGVDIRKVQEIRNYEKVTQIVNVPAYQKGVIYLRGIIVPIVDLRIKIGLETAQYEHQSVIIVIELNGQTTGVVADGVSDVIVLAPSQIKPAPPLSGSMSTDYILGLGSVEGRMLLLIDMDKVLGTVALMARGRSRGLTGEAAPRRSRRSHLCSTNLGRQNRGPWH